ncbi:hypothetical protein JCM15765_14240 [Paradesulfitobacterium aromaticivorans]
MAESMCARCGSTKFEMVHADKVEGATRSVLFVQCAECGAVSGVLDFINLGVQMTRLKEDWQRTLERLRRNFEP